MSTVQQKHLAKSGWIDIRENMKKLKKFYYTFDRDVLLIYKDADPTSVPELTDQTKIEITFDLLEGEFYQFECNNKQTLAEWLLLLTPIVDVVGFVHYPLQVSIEKSNYALPLPFYYSYQFLKSKDFPLTSPLIQPTCFDLSSLNESNFCKEITTPTQAHLIIHHFITSLTPPLIPAELTDAITDAMCRESLLNQVECLEKAFQQAQPPHRMVIILLFHYLNKMYEADYDILDEILDAYQDVFLPPPIISHLKREFVNMLVENYEYIFPNAQNEIEQIVPPDDSLQQLPMTNLSFFVKVVRSKLKVAQSENSEKKTEGSGTQTPTNDQVKLIFKKKPNKTNTFTTNIDDIEQTLKVYSLCDSPRSLEERLEAMKSKISELKQTVFEQDQIIQELQAAYEETQPQQQQ